MPPDILHHGSHRFGASMPGVTSARADRVPDERQRQTAQPAPGGLAILGLAVVVLSALAVAILGDTAVGALLGVLVLLAALACTNSRATHDAPLPTSLPSRGHSTPRTGVSPRWRRRSRRSQSTIPALSKEVTTLSKTVAQWSKDVKEAEIETGIAALNRYVALGSDDAANQA